MYRDFTPDVVVMAYRNAIFPMYDEFEQSISWYRPDPRAVIPLGGFHISRSLAKTIRQGRFELRLNSDFEAVMRGCADREEGSWINEEFIKVYGALHEHGVCHSVETWREGRLVGGVYGLALGSAFMAESMFHSETDASKVALAGLVGRLVEREYTLLDVQYLTPNLARLGAVEISHRNYLRRLEQALSVKRNFHLSE